MNSGCFEDGLLKPVHELLHTLGFVPEVLTYRHGLPDETWHEPNPVDPLSLIDQVELALAYNCADSLTKKNLVDYAHRNRKLNSMRIDTLEESTAKEIGELKDRLSENSARLD